MANISEILDIKQKHLFGKYIFSTVSRGHITNIQTPEDSSIVTVTANDLADKNVKIMNAAMPILADGYIHYLGQPIMAVFGPDRETVDMFCAQVEVNVEPEENGRFKPAEAPNVPPYTWTSGNVAKFFTEDAKIIESEFTVETQSEALSSDERIFASFNDDVCHIKLATQWPLHAKDTVASALGLTKAQVKIYSKNFRADFDQLLYKPSMEAAVAAVAAKKSGLPVELFVSCLSWQPETKFKRQTVVNNDGKPLAEKITVDADFGAYPLFSEEAYYNILGGLTPPYDVNAIEVVININKSSKAPASFFGDLGYGAAVAFTESHFTKVAQFMGKSPYEWRCENLTKVSLMSEKVRRCMTFDALKTTLDECATDSWFSRKYSVASQTCFANHKISPIAGYAKGVGIACAHGVGGFSEKYPYGGQHNVALTLTEDNKVYVTLGFYAAKDTVEIYRDLIQDRLNIEKDNILFTSLNSENVRDFGPSVLARSVCVVPKMLDSACSQLSKRIARGTKAPMTQQVFYPVEEDRPLFDANTFGSVSIALHIDLIKVTPVIDNITARLKFGKVFNTTILARRIRQTICTTISHLCPCIDNNYSIDLKVKSNPHLPEGSCSSMLCGITSAAFKSALSQALGHDVDYFPINDKDMISIIQLEDAKKEEEDEA